MTRPGLEPNFAAALRAELVGQVDVVGADAGGSRPPGHPARRRRRWFLGAGSAALAFAAAGTAYALTTTSPGGDEVTYLTPAQSHRLIGTATVELGVRPVGATGVEVEFSCLSPGVFRFPNGSSATCDEADPPRAAGDPAMMKDRYDLTDGQHSLTITAQPGAAWALSTRYIDTRETAWGRNAKGETYGVQNDHGEPDLILVVATNGRTGYVYTRELNAAGGPPPTDPSDAAVRLQALSAGIPVTVYESDGETVVGAFVIGGGNHRGDYLDTP